MPVTIEMPKLSDTMSVGTVVKWHKNVGDKVANGDTLAEIETDKATMELENFDDGVLLKILVKEGEEAPIGSPLAIVGEEGEEVAENEDTRQPTQEHSTTSPKEGSIIKDIEDHEMLDPIDDHPVDNIVTLLNSEPEETVAAPSSKTEKRIFASPLARKIASDQNIDLSSIKGTGPSGRIIKKDILGNETTAMVLGTQDQTQINPAVDELEPSVSPPPHSNNLLVSKTVPLSGMRSVIAKRLTESKTTIPHFYLQKEINIDSLLDARAAINLTSEMQSKRFNSEFIKISVNDLILKACAEAIKWHPEINTSWGKDEVIYHHKVDVAFGVAVDGGLLTPVIRNAETLSLTEISKEAKSLINLARDKKLAPDAMLGSTFTVTNLGMYGIDFFSGIINPPNAAILSVGSAIEKPIVNKNGIIVVGKTLTIGLSCDHRLVDGAIGAGFLSTLANNLENPSCMFL